MTMFKNIFFTAALLSSISSMAFAVDFKAKLTQLDGSPLVAADGKPAEAEATLGYIASNALLGQYSDETALSGEDKFKRWQLAAKIQVGKTDDLSLEDLALIKKLIAKNYAPLVVGQAWLLLDPGSAPKK